MFEKYFQKLFFISDLCVNGDFLLEEFRTAKENEKSRLWKGIPNVQSIGL